MWKGILVIGVVGSIALLSVGGFYAFIYCLICAVIAFFVAIIAQQAFGADHYDSASTFARIAIVLLLVGMGLGILSALLSTFTAIYLLNQNL